MPTKPKINVRLLRRIQKQIAKEPRQFDMNTWFAKRAGVPNCGTTACIAGWSLACAAKLNPLQAAKSIRKTFGCAITEMVAQQARDIEPKARKILGLTPDQAERLFHVHDWPDEFSMSWYAGLGDDQKRAKVAIARIDHFIASKGER